MTFKEILSEIASLSPLKKERLKSKLKEFGICEDIKQFEIDNHPIIIHSKQKCDVQNRVKLVRHLYQLGYSRIEIQMSLGLPKDTINKYLHK